MSEITYSEQQHNLYLLSVFISLGTSKQTKSVFLLKPSSFQKQEHLPWSDSEVTVCWWMIYCLLTAESF